MPDFKISVDYPLKSKERARLTKSGHAYMSASYREAQKEFSEAVRAQWNRSPLEGPIALRMVCYGSSRLDFDNLEGFVFDALGPGKGKDPICWVDDRVSVISAVNKLWVKRPLKESRYEIDIAFIEDLIDVC